MRCKRSVAMVASRPRHLLRTRSCICAVSISRVCARGGGACCKDQRLIICRGICCLRSSLIGFKPIASETSTMRRDSYWIVPAQRKPGRQCRRHPLHHARHDPREDDRLAVLTCRRRAVVCAGSRRPGNLHLINGLFDCHRSHVRLQPPRWGGPRRELPAQRECNSNRPQAGHDCCQKSNYLAQI